MKLATKLILLFFLISLVPLTAVSTLSYVNNRRRIEESTLTRLTSISFLELFILQVSQGDTLMTIATPIQNDNGRFVAVLAEHVDLSKMTKIMAQRSRPSTTEETYRVNKFNFTIENFWFMIVRLP